MNVLAGITKAVSLLNCNPDCQAAVLLLIEKRQVSLSNPGLLVDLRGAWLDSSFWHGCESKFRGREHNLVVKVAERALHILHYVSGSLEVPGTLLDCFLLTVDVLVRLSAGSPVGHGVAGSASPNVSYLLRDTFNVTPSIADASTATMVDTWEGLSECTSPVPPGSSAPTSPHEQTLMRAPGLSSLSVCNLATVFAGIAEASAVHAGNQRAQAEALLSLRAAWGLSLSDLALLAAIQRALHQVAFWSGVQLDHAAKFRGEKLGRVGNAAETVLRLLSKSAGTPPDAGQYGILDFFSLHLGVFDLLHVANLEPFADGTNVAVDN